MNKKISIIMGIYNCEETLKEAIESIIAQTYTNWELIMCDDGSQDNTYEVALKYQKLFPNKIILLRNKENLGLNYTLNKCLSKADGFYIARMDGDDVCDPKRLEEEVVVLENEKDISIVSADMELFDRMGVFGRVSLPAYPKNEDFLKGTPFCHACCMVRKDALYAVNGYSIGKRLLRVEDYHLWIKLYKAGFRGKNINKILYSMRDDRNACQRRKLRYRINEVYVKCLAIKELKLPVWGYIYAIKPILVGLLPKTIYMKMHRQRTAYDK